MKYTKIGIVKIILLALILVSPTAIGWTARENDELCCSSTYAVNFIGNMAQSFTIGFDEIQNETFNLTRIGYAIAGATGQVEANVTIGIRGTTGAPSYLPTGPWLSVTWDNEQGCSFP